MPTPSRALTNDCNDCKLIKLDSSDPKSPLVVVQEGYAPSDPHFRMRMYYLQRDGMWIDEIAHSTLPDAEAGDIVFETSAEALEALSGLFGNPHVRDLPVTEADARGFISLVRSGSPEDGLRQFLARHRAAKGRVEPSHEKLTGPGSTQVALAIPKEAMQTEALDIKEVMKSRRHAVEESLHTISSAELKALTDELFPYADHPWLEKFSEVVNDPASGTLHHAVVYCHGKNIGMWFILGSGKGPLQPDELKIMRELVEARP